MSGTRTQVPLKSTLVRAETEKVAKQFAELMKPFLDERHLLGPEEPAVSRIRNLYIRQLMIKIPENTSSKKIKSLIEKNIERLHTVTAYRSVRINIDVDPL